MRMVICLVGEDPAPWLNGLRQALPDVDIEEWRPGVSGADYAVVWAPPQQFIDEQQRSLRAIFNAGAGVDALLKLDIPPSLPIVRLDDAGMAAQMCEFVLHALVRHYRGMAAYERAAASGEWIAPQVQSRSEFPVGVLGLGVLGERVARLVGALEFPVLGWSRTPKRLQGMACYSGEAQLETFLNATRVLVNLLPLTPATQGVLDRKLLGQLRPGAFLINAARGGHLVERDLLEMIETGHIAGAALDVFEKEPLDPGHPFWRHPRIAVTPHVAAVTLPAESIENIAAKVRAMAAGRPVAGCVDRGLGY